MKNDAERAVVGVGIDGVDVGHLDESKRGKQRQAEHNDSGVGSGPCASVSARPWVKSGQTLRVLNKRGLQQEYTRLDALHLKM